MTATAAPATVTVDLGARRYDIHIGGGLLEQAGQRLSPQLRRRRVFVLTDDRVRQAQGMRLESGLAAAGVEALWITIPAGEGSKSFATLERVVEDLLTRGADRQDMLLAFGGGVVGDLGGFAAAITKRGLVFAQAPTTLLAQVDSAVGGKTAVNMTAGKNLAGVFYQPAVVIADVGALDTAPPRHIRAGYAEVVKYAALGDADFFEALERDGAALLAGDPAIRIRMISRCCRMKADIVARDETETGERALLNLGHTFGHALEAAYGFDDERLAHGEAVAAGMGLAFDFSVAQGLCPAADAARLKAHLRRSGLPAGFGDLPQGASLAPENLLAAMRHDKKTIGGALTFILARKIGDAFIQKDVSAEAVLAFLRSAEDRTHLSEKMR